MAEEFFEFGSSGRDEDLAEEGRGIINAKLSDFEIHPLSDDIVLAN